MNKNKKAISIGITVFFILAIGLVGYLLGTSSGATGYAVKTTKIDSSNICRYGEKQCGFEAGKSKKLECKTLSLIEDIKDYQNNIGKTGYEYCDAKGYDTCVNLYSSDWTIYYKSTDNTCKGKQLEIKKDYVRECSDQISEFNEKKCMNLLDPVTFGMSYEEKYDEPHLGDKENFA